MEDAEIVDVLHVPLLELRVDTVLLASEVQCVEGFCLRLSYGGDICTSRQRSKSNKVSASVLQRDSLGGLFGGGEMVHERSFRPLLVGLLESLKRLAPYEVKNEDHERPTLRSPKAG